ncbi:hypothetical protein [Rhizobium sp. EC-SD404]|uniref:hypothetical protein n=1 Tax=Rhizobium sp. EC-SD404 TaxID=2038389 RepID=UPI00125B224D|nr:hypothetical protein [Rhizobium sp. EC-SD404]VVT31735.1 hypothetical protein RHIZ404_230364 [Rhizobium sp. EC-SD404]
MSGESPVHDKAGNPGFAGGVGRRRSAPGLSYIACFAILIGCMAAGAILFALGALALLQWADGDARGGELVFFGFAILIGAAIGCLAGIVSSVLWLRGGRRTSAR